MIEAHNITNLEGNSLEQAVKSDFGLDINNSEKIIKGYSSQVYKAELDGKTVFIRMNKDKNVFEVEQLGYKIFEEQGIPVPKIITYKENPPSIGYPTMIMSGALGKTLGESKLSQEEKNIVYEKVGEFLNKINKTKLKGFGPLRVENSKLVGKFSSWKEYCKSQEEYQNKALDFCLNSKFITNDEASKITKIYEEVFSLDFRDASLLHRDIHQGHFFVEGTNITGIIDLGSIMAGDPRYDIAMGMVFAPKEHQEFLKKGYGDLANDPIVNKYMITIFVRKIFFRSKEEIKGNVNILLLPLKESLEKIP